MAAPFCYLTGWCRLLVHPIDDTQAMAFAKLIPVLLFIICAFAIYQLILAVTLVSRGEWPIAGLYLLMAVAGGALARTLWIARQKLKGSGR